MTNPGNQPFVPVILPVDSGGATPPRAVRSVVGQTLADWELLPVDDDPADGTSWTLQA
jgi:glycosyltransferase involved in cell wall biosynthesis